MTQLTYGSLFTGIGGFDLGFDRAGMRNSWQIENDKDCNRVLERHWHGTKRFGDITKVDPRELGLPDVVCGGFPCQDLSVAGRRAGLAGERSGLWSEFHRVVAGVKPRFVVIENVPGLLSSNEGRDMEFILGGLEKLGYCIAWTTLDSQYRGVAQRRNRVFIIGSLGDGRCAQVLFEPESVRGDTAPSRETRERVAGTIVARVEGGGGLGTDFEIDGGLVGALDSRHNVDRGDWNHNSKLIAHALRSEGSDASEDGTGRGTPIIPILEAGARIGKSTDDPRAGIGIGKDGDPIFSLQSRKQHAIAFDTTQITSKGNYSEPKIGNKCHPLASGAHPPAIAFSGKDHGQDAQDAVAFTERSRKDGRNVETQDDVSYAVTNPGSVGRTHSRQLMQGASVRRLTPRECERLQGFPDDWTRWDVSGKEISDSARYWMLGNAVTEPVAEWIGAQILKFV